MKLPFFARVRRALAGFALAATVGTAGGCAPAVSTQQEVQLGAQYSRQINQQLPLVTDPAANDYINEIGRRIARSVDQRGIPYNFYIVNSDVVNAFAVPGGYVYVNRGLIERVSNASELAGVLSHEIGHVVARHSIQQMQKAQNANNVIGILGSVLLGRASPIVQQGAQVAVQVGGSAIFAGFTRADEREADQLAVGYMVRTGYNPRGIVTMFQKLLNEQKTRPSAVAQWFSTHPLTQDRIAYTQAQINATPGATSASLTTDTRAFDQFRARVRTLQPYPRDRRR